MPVPPCILFKWLPVVAAAMLVPVTATGGERELWSLWERHQTAPDDHRGMVEACRGYAAALPGDPLLPAVRSLEAWHLLRVGETQSASALLSNAASGGSSGLERAMQRPARGWLTRILRGRLVDALDAYYRKEVRYPATLAELASRDGIPGGETLPMTDAWGRAWRYRLAGFARVPGFHDQRYLLESPSIEPPRELSDALALPYAAGINLRLARVPEGSVTGGDVIAVTFDGGGPDGSALVQEGQEVKGIAVAYAGRDLAVVCDALHWRAVRWSR